jgi:hypothetical protein
MATPTTNYNLKKPDTNDYYNVADQNGNMDAIDLQLKTNANAAAVAQSNLFTHQTDYSLQVPYAGTTTGTANTYAIATPTVAALTAGMAVCVKINVDSTAASTLNWCGLGAKAILKANGTAVTNLKASGIYTLRYDGTNFTLQGEGVSGTATASDLISGKTASTDAGDITGTMANNASPTATIVNQNATVVVPAGYSLGGTITATLTNLAAAVIKVGVTVGGILGSFTSDATAVAGNILSGITAYVNGSKITGTMPEQGSPTLQLGASIIAGHYSGGAVATTPHSSQTYVTPGTYTFTVPANVTQVTFIAIGGGGGGAGGGGGGGGGYTAILSVIPMGAVAVIVGAGGAGSGSGSSGTGGSGGNSSVSTLIGAGGTGGSGNAGGAAGNGGGYGAAGNAGVTCITGPTGGVGGAGGTYYGGAGGVAGSSNAGGAGNAPGGGGGGTFTGPTGGVGGAGKVIILW